MDVDYNHSTTPINLERILEGSASAATVQDFNYYSNRSIRSRYVGSRNTTDNFNTSSTTQTVVEGNEFKQSYQPTLMGSPSVELLDTILYSVVNGGGASPEILGAGATTLSSIYIFGEDKDDIAEITPNQENHKITLNNSLSFGDKISLFQYESTATVPNNLNVVATNIKVPSKSQYMIPSDDQLARAFFRSPGSYGDSIEFNIPSHDTGAYNVGISKDGYYVTGSFVTSSELVPELKEAIDVKGEDWYVSIYEVLGSEVVYEGVKAIKNYKIKDELIPGKNPLAYYGVSKITSAVYNVGSTTLLTLEEDISDLVSGLANIGNNGEYGILIWRSEGESIIVENSSLSGVGQGVFYKQHSSDVINNDLHYITKTYDNNKK